ncbi:MAG: glycosyltransferase, partial [Burkholderiaceae bacterium]
PDIIESADPYRLAWATLDAAQALGVPAVAFCHSNLEQMARMAAGERWQAPAAAAARRYAAHLYRQFDLVLAPSQAMADHLTDWGVKGAQRQSLGVDTTTFFPADRDPNWRAAHGLPNDARVLIYAGRFAPEKNLGLLVDAVRLLGPRHWLVAVGAGPAVPSGDRVLVLPQVAQAADLAALLVNADLFVHAGTQETFGLSALEALACGVPVVAPAAEGLAELVDDSLGCAVQRPSAQSLAEAIAATLARDRHALGRAARARGLAHDWNQVLPQLWQHYRRVMACGPIDAAPAARALQP